MSWQIDVTPASQQRGPSRVSLSPEHKAASISIEADGDPVDRLALALRSASVKQLKLALVRQLKILHEDHVLSIGAEFTKRSIAPCFRGIALTDEWVQVFWGATKPLLLLLDMQWIASTYPGHSPEWKRSTALFNPDKFRKEADFLSNEGKREAGQIVKALALTEAMQLECLFLQCLHVARWRKFLDVRLPIAQAKIEAAIRSTDKRSIEDQNATIERRTKLWLCAELANRKPQRTAELFKMMTGENMQRATVGTQLGKLPKVRQADENATDTGVGWGM